MANTASTDISAASKRSDNATERVVRKIFLDNWKRVFLVDASDGSEVSYGEFYSRVTAYQGAISARGLVPGDSVSCVLGNSIETIILYFSAFLGGFRIAAVDPLRGNSEKKDSLTQIDSRLTLVSRSEDAALLHGAISFENFSAGVGSALGRSSDVIIPDVDQVSLVTFTSGSTGNPKGVMHSFGNLVASAVAFRDAFGFSSKNIFYHNLPMTYIAGILNQVILPFVSGATIVVGNRFSIIEVLHFWDNPKKFGVNTFWIVPAIISLLNKVHGGRPQQYNAGAIACVGTAPLPYRTRIAFESAFNIPLYESYGLSETLFNATESPYKPLKKGSVGTALAGVEFDIAQDNEILVRCPWEYYGYTHEHTGAKKRFDFFPSGDFGTIDDDGYVFITGRKKDVVIRGGINISPKRIEDLVDECGVFAESVVIGCPDEVLGEKIVCFFVPGKQNQLDARRAVTTLVVRELGSQFAIDEFVELPELPRLTNGKIDRVSLKKG